MFRSSLTFDKLLGKFFSLYQVNKMSDCQIIFLIFSLDKATSHLHLEPDWVAILQICDLIRQGDVQ